MEASVVGDRILADQTLDGSDDQLDMSQRYPRGGLSAVLLKESFLSRFEAPTEVCEQQDVRGRQIALVAGTTALVGSEPYLTNHCDDDSDADGTREPSQEVDIHTSW
jgi:hypothetical protein